VRFDTSLAPDITVAVRLDQPNHAPLDYYLLPRLDFGLPRISLAEHNGIEFESYRFDSLDYLHGMIALSFNRSINSDNSTQPIVHGHHSLSLNWILLLIEFVRYVFACFPATRPKLQDRKVQPHVAALAKSH
jgi:hypothetical protein